MGLCFGSPTQPIEWALSPCRYFFCINFIPAFRSSFAFLMQIRFKTLAVVIAYLCTNYAGTIHLLLQLIFVYYVLPSVGITFDRMPAVILAFTLNYAASISEIFRGGLKPSLPANTKPLKY